MSEGGMPPQGAPELLRLLQQFTVATDRYVDAVSDRTELHRTDLNALAVMAAAEREGQTVTPSSLRHALNLSSPATTALVDRLDRAGHVTRSRSNSDRRQVHLEMTDTARSTGASMFLPLAQAISPLIARLSPAELQTVTTFMRQAILATEEAGQQASDLQANGVIPEVPVTDRPLRE